jgi:hypothetical protein
VDRGATVSVGTSRGEVEVGHERRKRTKRGSSSAGHSPYSRMRRWLRQLKWGGGDYGGRWRPLSKEVGTVRTQSAHGSDRAADGWAPRGCDFSNLTKTGSKLEFEKEHLTVL